jgi:acetoacetyl-CoA synthetase
VSGRILWSPPRDQRQRTNMGRYMTWLEEEHGLQIGGWDDLWRFSVEDLEGFWASIWEFFDIQASEPYDEVLTTREMPGARWFTASRLNYVQHMMGTRDDDDRVAIVARSQTREPLSLTFAELREQVARCRWGLLHLGVGPGDRVVGYLPNTHETIVAFIATASLGATWATCAPEFGSRSVIDRFAQIEPKVLLTVGGYGFRDRYIDRTDEVAKVRAALPTVEHVVHVPYGEAVVPDAMAWEDLLLHEGPLEFEQVPFDHPLVVLFSSGTTGLPKAIVHGHGNLLVEHLKAHGLQWDLGPEKRLLQFTTTAWMMWNALVSALLLRSSIVLMDGDPTWPDLGLQWRLAAETGATHVGMSPAFVMACRKAGLQPGRDLDLSRLRTVVTAGSPLPPEGFQWLYEQLGEDMLLINGSGGTDVCSAFITGNVMVPVYEGELAAPALGVDCKAFDEDGNPVVGELGEFVVTEPMPSMPVRLWGDDEQGTKLREAYFDRYPGVWRQGDWALFTERGSCIITGRSDATLNRGGVRLGTSEIYATVEDVPEVVDSLIVHLEDREGGAGELLLFVVLRDGVTLDEGLEKRIKGALRSELSPRHAPDTIVAVPAVPRTRTGKKLETPVKRILRGAKPEDVASRDALLDPSAIDAFIDYAARTRTPA